jgi:peptidoglycan hydrolase-like amidase
MAKAGNTAAQILAHYYSGTAVEPLTGQLAAAIPRQPRG